MSRIHAKDNYHHSILLAQRYSSAASFAQVLGIEPKQLWGNLRTILRTPPPPLPLSSSFSPSLPHSPRSLAPLRNPAKAGRRQVPAPERRLQTVYQHLQSAGQRLRLDRRLHHSLCGATCFRRCSRQQRGGPEEISVLAGNNSAFFTWLCTAACFRPLSSAAQHISRLRPGRRGVWM